MEEKPTEPGGEKEESQEAKPAQETPKQEKIKPQKAPIFDRLKAWTLGKLERIRRFITECKRVLRVTRKPDKQEFLIIVKISSIGMAVIGLIGFAVFFLKEIIVG